MMVVGPLGRQALLHLLAATVFATATTGVATAAAAPDHHAGGREVGGAGEGDHAQRRRHVGAQGSRRLRRSVRAIIDPGSRPSVLSKPVPPQMKRFRVRGAPRLASARPQLAA